MRGRSYFAFQAPEALAGLSQEQYLPVDDEGTLMAVFELFRDKFKDLIEFQEPEAGSRAFQILRKREVPAGNI